MAKATLTPKAPSKTSTVNQASDAPPPRMSLYDVPEYAQAKEKLVELENKRATLTNRDAALQMEWEQLVGENPRFQSLGGFSVREFERHEKAQALLSDDAAGKAQVSSRAVEIRTELAKINEELEILDRAIKLQEPIVDRAHTQACRVVCEALFPHHEAIVQRLANAALSLEDAVAEHRAFARELECEDIRPVGRLNISGIARFSDGSLRVAIAEWIARLKGFGYAIEDRNLKVPK